MNEKTLEEQLEEELKDQLTDISMLHTRVVDHIISGVGTVLPVLATGIMYAVGMNFEKTGTLTSTFFRNLVGKMKVTK